MNTQKLRRQHPDRVPVILKRSGNCTLPELERTQYLVPRSITLGSFTCTLRSVMKLNQSEGLILFINKELPPFSLTFDEMDEKYSVDGLLTISIASESVFG